MRLTYSAQALNLYARQTGQSILQITETLGLSYSTVNRYSRGERLPDIGNLLLICNTLRLRVSEFFVHPDLEQTRVNIYLAEEWSDIVFRFDRIEAIRLGNNLTKAEMIQAINEAGGCNITKNTYNQLIAGKHQDWQTVLGVICSQDVELDYLFEQAPIGTGDDSVVISRKKLSEMKSYIAQLEATNRELEVKNKRLEKKALPRYQERMANKDADKIIREFVRKVGRAYADLQSWIDEDSGSIDSPHYDLSIKENFSGMVAERDYQDEYGKVKI